MGIFSRTSTSNLQAPVFEGYSASVDGDIIALQESYEDQLNIIKAIHAIDSNEISFRTEMKSLQESGASSTKIDACVENYQAVSENMVKSAWGKIVTFLKNLWGKVKSFFDSLVRFFVSLGKSGKDFVKKYESNLRGLKLNGFKYKMFEYTHLDGELPTFKESDISEFFELAEKALSGGNAEEIKKDIEGFRENREKIVEETRGELLKQGPLNEEEYARELYKFFRNKKVEPEEVSVNINEIMGTLSKSQARDKVEKFVSDTDKVFSNAIAKTDQLEKKVVSVSPDKGGDVEMNGKKHNIKGSEIQNTVLDCVRHASSLISTYQSTFMALVRAWKEAYVERDRTYKHVALAAFHHKEK